MPDFSIWSRMPAGPVICMSLVGGVCIDRDEIVQPMGLDAAGPIPASFSRLKGAGGSAH